MGGFARELDDVRRASTGRPGPAAPTGGDAQAQAEVRLFELWKQHTASSRVLVDVVAGTSAGGLNGVLLAMAIAGDTPLTMLRGLWMRAAQLDEQGLLRPQEGEAASVLNGDYFLEQVHEALTDLATSSSTDGADVTLTVTSTALRGRPRTVRDARGAVFTEPDHRRRFEFRRTGQRVRYDATAPAGEEFSTSTQDDFRQVDAVALTARASASFPGAFAPVAESAQMRPFRRWPTWDTGPELEWLADGGILDNSPFEPVLQAISERPVESTWHRTLCYVVPSADESDPGRAISDPSLTAPGLQPPWTSVTAASFGLPREADLRDDVEQIHEVLRAGRSSYDVSRLGYLLDPAKPDRLKGAITLASNGFPLYRQARAAAAIYQIRDATLPPEMFVISPG
jgi:patatin-related protein